MTEDRLRQIAEIVGDVDAEIHRLLNAMTHDTEPNAVDVEFVTVALDKIRTILIDGPSQ